MKTIIFTCLIALFSLLAFGQTEAQKFRAQQLSSKRYSDKEFKSGLSDSDFSQLFTRTKNYAVYGFIGAHYQRIRIKFIKVEKDISAPYTYHVYGKSMVKTNIDNFSGTITISNIRKQKAIANGVDGKLKNNVVKGEYILLGDYSLTEGKNQSHSGSFKGTFKSSFFLDKGNHIRYNDIESFADGFTNNDFVGQWTDYKTHLSQRCNWGDFRIPNSGDLDIGAGEFSPARKYLKYGWQTVSDMYGSLEQRNQAKVIEEANWWK